MGWDQSSDTVVIEDLTFVFFINCRFDSKLAAPRHEFAKDQCSQHKFADILWWWMCFGACGASILHIVKQIDCFEGALPFWSLTDSLPPRLSRLPHLPHLRWVTDLTYLVIIPKKLNSERSDILWRFAMWRCLVSNLSCFIWFDVKISEDSSNEWAQVGMISLIKTSASSSARFDVKTSPARIPQTVHTIRGLAECLNGSSYLRSSDQKDHCSGRITFNLNLRIIWGTRRSFISRSLLGY